MNLSRGPRGPRGIPSPPRDRGASSTKRRNLAHSVPRRGEEDVEEEVAESDLFADIPDNDALEAVQKAKADTLQALFEDGWDSATIQDRQNKNKSARKAKKPLFAENIPDSSSVLEDLKKAREQVDKTDEEEGPRVYIYHNIDGFTPWTEYQQADMSKYTFGQVGGNKAPSSSAGGASEIFNGATTTTSGGGGLFGSSNVTAGSGNLFGSSSMTPSSGSGTNNMPGGTTLGGSSNTFGGASSATPASGFGQTPASASAATNGTPASTAPNGSLSVLGNLNSTSSAGNGGSVFSTTNQRANSPLSGSNVFGKQPATSASAGNPLFGGSSTPPTSNSNQQNKNTSSVFGTGGGLGGSTPPGTGLFQNLGGSRPVSGTTTPQGHKPSPLSFSTTPAGNPPAAASMFTQPRQTENQQPASSGVGQSSTTLTVPGATANTGASRSNLFGEINRDQNNRSPFSLTNSGPNVTSSAQPSVSQTTTSGSMFQPASAQSASANATQAQQSSSLPGAAQASDGNANGAASSATNMFSGLSGQQSAAPSSQAAPSGTSIFQNLGGQQAATSTQAAPGVAGTGLFQNLGGQQSAAPAAQAASGTSSTGLFQNLGGQTSSAAPQAAATTTAGPSGGLSSFFPSQSGATSSSLPAATTATSGSTLLSGNPFSGGNQTQPATAPTTSATQAGTSTAAPAASSTLFGGGAGPAASTSGPAPPTQSRLSGMTMDEIITSWSTSLASHQKTFANLATQISTWDRALVENSGKISRLYGRCFQAERDCGEVERQLSVVEHGQQELDNLLERYERDVDEMIERSGGGDDGIGGVDGEREATYKKAEACSSRLTEMSHSLTDMIEEINAASSKLSNNSSSSNRGAGSTADGDPLSQIVRVLNGHLNQLQSIDSGASALQMRVESAQREQMVLSQSRGVNGGGWVEDFGRSYLGRR